MKHISRKITFAFILTQLVLYIAFLTLDLSASHIQLSTNIKFVIIVLCFCYALLPTNSANRSILFCYRFGMFFTMISDIFLLLGDQYFYGVITFIIVQQLYGIRIDLSSEFDGSSCGNSNLDNLGYRKRENRSNFDNNIYKKIIKRFILQVAFTLILVLIFNSIGAILDRVAIVSIFYFICILTNTIRAIKRARVNAFDKQKKAAFMTFALGMLLFLLCDINVGIFNLSGFISIPQDIYEVLYQVSSILMWTFYAPSQVLIALSSRMRSR